MNISINSRLQVIGSTQQAIRMVCANAMTINDDVCAYISGIRVGISRIEGEFEAGDIIEYPISYLPWTDLPATVRFVSDTSGEEIAEPFHIRTHDEAVALVGVGETVVQNIVIDQGMVRGIVVNRVNGLLRPQMFARINGLVPRNITVDAPRLLDDGGASFQFAAPLLPADLGEHGLTAEIFLLGQDTPLTSIAFRRADVDDLTRRIVEFDTRLSQVSQSMDFRFKKSDQRLEAKIDVMQQRIEAFIEYAASFMFDRVAATTVPTVPGATPLPADLRAKVDAFFNAVKGNPPKQSSQSSTNISLESPSLSFGWDPVEEEDGVTMRRLRDFAVIFNPHPERAVSEIRLMLCTSSGASQPAFRAAFDKGAATVVIEQGKRKATRWRARVRPQDGDKSVLCTALSLINMSDETPSRSLAVSELSFIYAP